MIDVIKGIIFTDGNDVEGITLHLRDGENKISLLNEFECYDGKNIQVNYWISSTPKTKEELIISDIERYYGKCEAESEMIYTGSWTYGCESSYGCYEKKEAIKIGGHDLHEEIKSFEGKFILIEIHVK